MKNFTDPGIIELITKIKGALPKIATTTTAGITKPDGTTVTVDANGKTSVTISNLTAKSTVADGDSFMIGDSADSTVKKTLFSTIKTTLATTFATLANRQTFTGAKAFSKGLISYGNDTTTLPTNVGDYITIYAHDTYGLRLLGYNGTTYRPFTMGAMISTGVFAMQILANGDVLVNGRLRLPSMTTDPTGSLLAGMSYYNSTDKVMKYYDGTAWKKIGGGTAAETAYSNTTSGLTATNVQAAIDEVHNEAKNSVQTSSIENDLLGTDATKVLSAPQGKVLDGKITTINSNLALVSGTLSSLNTDVSINYPTGFNSTNSIVIGFKIELATEIFIQSYYSGSEVASIVLFADHLAITCRNTSYANKAVKIILIKR